MNSIKTFALAAVLAISGSSFAQTRTTTYSTSGSSMSGRFALGFKQHDFVGAIPAGGTINAQFEVFNRGFVGLNFGLDQDFETVFIAPEFRYNMVDYGDHAFYTEAVIGFLKTLSGVEAFVLNTLVGFDMQIYRHLRAQVGFGLHMNFGEDMTNNHFATTNGDFVGNFGIRWVF